MPELLETLPDQLETLPELEDTLPDELDTLPDEVETSPVLEDTDPVELEGHSPTWWKLVLETRAGCWKRTAPVEVEVENLPGRGTDLARGPRLSMSNCRCRYRPRLRCCPSCLPPEDELTSPEVEPPEVDVVVETETSPEDDSAAAEEPAEEPAAKGRHRSPARRR